MGNGDAPTHAFAAAHAAQLWQQPAIDSNSAPASTRTAPAELRVVLAFATAAALAVKAPVLFGIPLSPDTEPPLFYLRNASLFVFPLLAAYLMWQRAANGRKTLTLALAFAVGGYFANAAATCAYCCASAGGCAPLSTAITRRPCACVFCSSAAAAGQPAALLSVGSVSQ